MVKLALNFICKNESHVIDRMLNSAKPIVDLIVACDTGSDDDTIDKIKKFGNDNNIQTYVFQRSFDNFENSRNYALQKLIEVVNVLGWGPDEVFGFWFDCDEILVIERGFSKANFIKDFYMINAYINNMRYTRNTFFRVSKKFRWYGVVHEYLVCDDKDIKSDIMNNIYINVNNDGHSWKGDVSDKYRNHAIILENYINNNRQDPRWIFYTAQSWFDSAKGVSNRSEFEERLRRALKYYKERVLRNDGYYEEIYFSQLKIAEILNILDEPWPLVHMELLKAYSIDCVRGESIKFIIDYYLRVNEFNIAYIYSKFAMSNFHLRSPTIYKRFLFIDESLYLWRFAESHAACCYYTQRYDEGLKTMNEIKNIMKNEPRYFNERDIKMIEHNMSLFKKHK